MFKVCRCCDAIIGELETDDSHRLGMDYSLEVVGNVAYTLCSQCMRELDGGEKAYYQ